MHEANFIPKQESFIFSFILKTFQGGASAISTLLLSTALMHSVQENLPVTKYDHSCCNKTFTLLKMCLNLLPVNEYKQMNFDYFNPLLCGVEVKYSMISN